MRCACGRVECRWCGVGGRREAWPNGLGFDLVKASGEEFSFLAPGKPGGLWRVNHFGPEESYADKYGSGASPEAALANLAPVAEF